MFFCCDVLVCLLTQKSLGHQGGVLASCVMNIKSKKVQNNTTSNNSKHTQKTTKTTIKHNNRPKQQTYTKQKNKKQTINNKHIT